MTARSGGGRVRQRLTAGVGAVVLVVVVLALNFYQLPVVALSPGPAEDVLSRVKIEGGTQVYDSKGRFYLTSVGIDDDVRFFEAILDLANRDVQLRPRSDIYPQGESTQQVNQQNADDMDESKVLAAAVAGSPAPARSPRTARSCRSGASARRSSAPSGRARPCSCSRAATAARPSSTRRWACAWCRCPTWPTRSPSCSPSPAIRRLGAEPGPRDHHPADRSGLESAARAGPTGVTSVATAWSR